MRDLDGVENIGLAGGAHLALMGLGAEQVGAVDVGYVLGLKIGFQNRAQVADLEPLRGRQRGDGQRRLRLRFRPLCRRLG